MGMLRYANCMYWYVDRMSFAWYWYLCAMLCVVVYVNTLSCAVNLLFMTCYSLLGVCSLMLHAMQCNFTVWYSLCYRVLSASLIRFLDIH